MLVVVPAAAAIDILRQAEALGSRAAILFSGGFGEGDRAGSPLDLELKAFLSDTPMAVCGPNTNGVINCVDRIPAGFPPYAMADKLPSVIPRRGVSERRAGVLAGPALVGQPGSASPWGSRWETASISR